MKKFILLGLTVCLLTGCLPQLPETAAVNLDTVGTLVAATLTAESEPKDLPDLTAAASVFTITPDPALPTSDPTTATLTPTSTNTATATPTPTVSSTPTKTSIPTLAPEDPVLSLGIPSVKDIFDNGSIIYQYNESQSSFKVVDGKFVLTAKKANNYETWSLSWEELKNFYLEITGTFGSECAGKDRYGMIFRAPDVDEGYLISISCDGSFRLSSWESEEEKYTTIKNWTTSEHINAGPGGQNRLGVWVKGTKITGYINGRQVFELNDSTFGPGRFGVLVAASNTAGFKASLSQVVYWKLP